MPIINTFVFFDIETTSLPRLERNQTKIIEFSFVATLRKKIEATPLGEIPRVSKLSFVLNPKRPIAPKVTEMTGLTNEFLEDAPTFRKKVKSVIAFLQDLPPPVCLVAHNGNLFDYKILLAELNDVKAKLPEDLLCVDSLLGLRSILKGSDINYESLKSEMPSSSDELDDIMTDDEDEWPDFDISVEDWDEIDQLCTAETQKRKPKSKSQRKKGTAKAVFKERSNTKRECFKLETLYKRLLNKESCNAHRAEADCMMLLECVVALKHEFLTWADAHCQLLSNIQPLIRC